MIVFSYDTTFEGLHCAVFDAYTHKVFPDMLLPEESILPLHTTSQHHVMTEQKKFERVYAGLSRKLTTAGMRQLMYTWLSEEPDCDTLLFRYICKVFNARCSIEGNCSDSDVLGVTKLARKVADECSRMLGFVRFQKTTEGVYFAAIAPRHHILPLILPHFTDRFADQQWVIYDTGRQTGFFFDTKKIHEMHIDSALVQNGKLQRELLDSDEELFQQLWKNYFAAATIDERRNLKQQRRCMPERFWQYLPEMHK